MIHEACKMTAFLVVFKCHLMCPCFEHIQDGPSLYFRRVRCTEFDFDNTNRIYC